MVHTCICACPCLCAHMCACAHAPVFVQMSRIWASWWAQLSAVSSGPRGALHSRHPPWGSPPRPSSGRLLSALPSCLEASWASPVEGMGPWSWLLLQLCRAELGCPSLCPPPVSLCCPSLPLAGPRGPSADPAWLPQPVLAPANVWLMVTTWGPGVAPSLQQRPSSPKVRGLRPGTPNYLNQLPPARPAWLSGPSVVRVAA